MYMFIFVVNVYVFFMKEVWNKRDQYEFIYFDFNSFFYDIKLDMRFFAFFFDFFFIINSSSNRYIKDYKIEIFVC